MEKSNRNLKIVQSFSATHLPYLPLQWRWLERAGFTVGMRVDVLVKDQCLIVLPSKSPEK
jgi:Toxin SymE, type I toxin-antitoxin system